MNEKEINQIFLKHKLGEINSIKKIDIGFTNKVYSIDDKFILKVYDNKDNFNREVYFYNFFKDKLPVPKIIVHEKNYIIYNKIQGDNLYSKWHLMNDKQRKNIVHQLCDILKTINQAPHQEAEFNWHNKITEQINDSLEKVKTKKIISPEFIQAIKTFVVENHEVLTAQKLVLVYWDAHFDNILVKDNQIVGILDFERTKLSSIDFGLDIIKRMQEYPKKYMSEESEKFCKPGDYAHLLEWFKEFYHELFNFKDIDKRLDLYAIEHDLNTLIKWPDSDEVKQIIAKTINYKINDIKKDHEELVREHFEKKYYDYDILIRKLIPKYESMHDLVLKTLNLPQKENSRILELGIGTGETSLRVLKKYPNVIIDGVDFSTKMLNLAKQRLKKHNSQINFFEQDINDFEFKQKYNAAIAVLCIHHLNSKQKQAFFYKLFNALDKDGIFIIADLVTFPTKKETQEKEKEWKDFLVSNLGEKEGDYWFKNSKQEEDLPDSTENQIKWLKAAGFKKTKCIWKEINYSVFYGQK